MVSHGGHHSKHHTRFYILMVTLVVAGIFLFLFVNNNSSDSGLTSAIIGYSKEGVQEAGEESVAEKVLEKAGVKENQPNTLLKQSPNRVPLLLSFSAVPFGKKMANIDQALFRFDDLTTTITVNDDKLELSNLKEVELSISNFDGHIDFVDDQVSLAGTAKVIAVNGVSFASEKEISISFEGLRYTSLVLKSIGLSELELGKGNGEINVGDKLTYVLEGDEVNLFSFQGDVRINDGESSGLDLEGSVQGASVSGDLLNFNLR